jgi:hypothetical protein
MAGGVVSSYHPITLTISQFWTHLFSYFWVSHRRRKEQNNKTKFIAIKIRLLAFCESQSSIFRLLGDRFHHLVIYSDNNSNNSKQQKIMTIFNVIFLLSALLLSSCAFQPTSSTRASLVRPSTEPPSVLDTTGSFPSSSRLFSRRSSSHQWLPIRDTAAATAALRLSSSFPLRSSTAKGDGDDDAENGGTMVTALRDRLRRATGFSFTVFRATLRGITGISLTAIYASTVAATGLWIRKICSVVLSLFPSWFRYFLQPFLVLYYAPLFLLRNLTGPTRKRAKAQHDSVLGAWKEAVQYAEKTEKDGYWPVVVSEDGYFEMVAPPDPEETTFAEQKERMADAMAETVEHAMEVNEEALDNNKANK